MSVPANTSTGSDCATPATAGDAVDRALARALLARFVATAFSHPDAEARRTLPHLLDAVPEAFRIAHPEEGHLDADAARTRDALDGIVADHGRTFGHTVRGRHPLYGTEFGNDRDGLFQPHEIADIAGLYRALGIRLRPGVREREDHLAIQAEALQVLFRLEAHGLEVLNAEQASATRDAAAALLRDHLGPVGIPLMRRIGAEAGFYGPAARMAEAILEAACRELGVEVEPEPLTLRVPLIGPDEEIRCGSPGAPPAPPFSEMEV